MKTLILAAALAALAAPALAQGETDVRQTALRYSDLDLRQPEGADRMLARIRAAAAMVCAPAPLPRELGEWARYRACRAQAADAAVRQVDAPLVTARYARRPTMLVAR